MREVREVVRLGLDRRERRAVRREAESMPSLFSCAFASF